MTALGWIFCLDADQKDEPTVLKNLGLVRTEEPWEAPRLSPSASPLIHKLTLPSALPQRR